MRLNDPLLENFGQAHRDSRYGNTEAYPHESSLIESKEPFLFKHSIQSMEGIPVPKEGLLKGSPMHGHIGSLDLHAKFHDL